MSEKIIVALLAVPEVTASTLYGLHDLLRSAGHDWGLLTRGQAGESRFIPRIVSRDGRPLQAANGLWVHPQAALSALPTPDVIAIADLFVAPEADLSGRYDPEVAWLRRAYAAGSLVATACSGALLLAEAGLLAGQDCTTHWGYCDALRRRCPDARVHPQRALVVSGAGQRLVMAGGGTAWHDLALYLIARHAGAETAMQVARVNLIDWHHIGQQPYANLLCNRPADDAVIGDCQRWLAGHYDGAGPIAAMVARSGLSERTFKRRFTRATGMTPMAYLHTLRVEEAKQMLEAGGEPVEAIAQAVGYEDASFFSRLFRRKVGLTPAQYRRRFGALHRALGGPVTPA